MPFGRPLLSDLITRSQSDFDGRLLGSDSRLLRSFLNVLAKVVAGGFHLIYGFLAWIARQILPDTCDEDGVLRWASLKKLVRVSGVQASGHLSLTGTGTPTVLAGTLLQRGDGVEVLATAPATIASGVASLAVQAVLPGVAGNSDAGMVFTFVSPVGGVNSTAPVDGSGLTGGIDEETVEELRVRVLDALADPPAGGNDGDYQKWAKSASPEVTRVWVYPNLTGLGTVGVAFVMDNRPVIIPLSGDVALVQAAIDAVRPVTAAATAFAPTASALNYSITLTPNTAPVQAAVTAALADLHSREAEPGGTLLISHIRQAVSEAAGETDSVITSPTANVTAASGHISTLGTITF